MTINKPDAPDTTGILSYENNNSGGVWWLSDQDWFALAEAGWTVHWARVNERSILGVASRIYVDADDPSDLIKPIPMPDINDGPIRYMGALAVSAAKRFVSAEVGALEFETVANQNLGDEGCNCCGQPHNMRWYPDGGSDYPQYLTLDRQPRNWSFE